MLKSIVVLWLGIASFSHAGIVITAKNADIGTQLIKALKESVVSGAGESDSILFSRWLPNSISSNPQATAAVLDVLNTACRGFETIQVKIAGLSAVDSRDLVLMEPKMRVVKAPLGGPREDGAYFQCVTRD